MGKFIFMWLLHYTLKTNWNISAWNLSLAKIYNTKVLLSLKVKWSFLDIVLYVVWRCD